MKPQEAKMKEHQAKAKEATAAAAEMRAKAKSARDSGNHAEARKHEAAARGHEQTASDYEDKADEAKAAMDEAEKAEKKEPATAPRVAFAQLTKVDEEKRLVYGRATEQVPDRQNEQLDYAKSKPYFERWSSSQMKASMGKSAGNVRGMHGKVAAGIIVPEQGIMFNDAEKAIDIVSHVVDDAEWNKVLTGTYTGFSIGGRYVSKSAPDSKSGVVSYVADPSEISLVDRPSLPSATFFEVHKADGSTEQREFSKVEDQEADKTKAIDDPKREEQKLSKLFAEDGSDLELESDVSKVAEGGEFIVGERSFLLKKSEDGKATVEEQYKIDGSEQDLSAFAKVLSTRGIGLADAVAILEKETPTPLREPTDSEVLAKAAQMAYDEEKLDLLKTSEDDPKRATFVKLARLELRKIAAREDVSGADKKRAKSEYGTSDFADEKNKKYPIDTPEHIRAAWNYINKNANAAKYGPDEVKTIKAKIVSAWKSKIDKAGPPSAEEAKKFTDAELKKAIGAVAGALAKAAGVTIDGKTAADAQAKPFFEKSAEIVERLDLVKGLYEVSRLSTIIASLCDLMNCVEMEAFREGDKSDLGARLSECVQELGDVLVDMAEEEVSEEVKGTEAYVPAMPVAVQMAASARDLSKAAKVHVDWYAKRDGGTDEKGRAQRVHDRAVELGAACAHAAHASTSIAKVDDSDLRKALGDALKRIETLERQPAQTAKTIVVRAVSKGDDSSGGDQLQKAAAIAAKIEPVRKSDGSIDDAATAVKIMQAMGGSRVTLGKTE